MDYFNEPCASIHPISLKIQVLFRLFDVDGDSKARASQ